MGSRMGSEVGRSFGGCVELRGGGEQGHAGEGDGGSDQTGAGGSERCGGEGSGSFDARESQGRNDDDELDDSRRRRRRNHEPDDSRIRRNLKRCLPRPTRSRLNHFPLLQRVHFLSSITHRFLPPPINNNNKSHCSHLPCQHLRWWSLNPKEEDDLSTLGKRKLRVQFFACGDARSGGGDGEGAREGGGE